MDTFLIFLSFSILTFAAYIVWPSRFNVLGHAGAAASFIAIVVPTFILHLPEKAPADIVGLYTNILVLGVISFLPGMIAGFNVGKYMRTNFSFDIMEPDAYERRIIKLTKILLLVGIVGLAVSYAGMGFIPMFAANPIAAKLFRDQYQAPYYRVAVIFRSSWFILTTIIPIACIIWYKYRSKFFLFATLVAVTLMIASLQRSGAFNGIVFAFIIVMAFKSRKHFVILMVVLTGIFVMSSFFYYIVGVRTFDTDRDIWEVIGESSPDIRDQLQFLEFFEANPEYTYGRTIYGGLIPGHYKWNPAVYTLLIINPGRDINELESGGLRLVVPLWGYVSFSWPGVVVYSLLTGLFSGLFLGMLKSMFKRYQSIIIRTTALITFGSIFGILAGFTTLTFYMIPPAIISLFYMYRFRLK
ncbi:O-antigen polymerase [Mucilaginibacter sp.]